MTNRAYCIGVGDFSQLCWFHAPEWQKESARKGVKAVLNGDNPKQLHQSWVEEKVRDGWIYGEVKDATLKTHPCMVQYSDLPDLQRRKDEIFQDTVKELFLLQIVF